MNIRITIIAAALAVALAPIQAKPLARAAAPRKPSATPAAHETPAPKKDDAPTSKPGAGKKSDTTKKDQSTTLAQEVKNSDSKSGATSANTALLITISGELKERGETFALFSKRTKSLKDYLDVMRRARDDKDVKSVVIRLAESEIGMAMGQELRQSIAELRAKGKKTYGIVDTDSQVAYLIACACDEVVMPPSGDLMLYGVKADAYFFRSLLAKLGVTADVVHMGKYKSYGEMFTNDDFTSPARENMDEIVGDVYGQLVSIISSARKLTKEQVEEAINRGPSHADEAKTAKLIDRVQYADDLLKELKKNGATITDSSDYAKESSSKGDDVSLLSILSMMGQKQSSSDKSSKFPQVAILYALGPIVSGSQEGMLNSSDQIASDDFIKTLDDIQEDKKIKAVILRVDSPGGSAFASDLIWKKIDELKKVKPVVASMGDVAASGGYYIAMAANKIIAQEGTFTGSIGVVGGKVNLSGVYSKIGINKSTVSRGEFATLFSETNGFTGKDRELIERMMHRTYDEFVSKAAEGRKMPKDKLEAVAQGKVWMGARAKTVGLVDDVGGMPRAIQEVKLLIGLKKDDKVSLVAYPKEVGLLDLLQKAFGNSTTVAREASPDMLLDAMPLPASLRQVLRVASSMATMFEHEKVLMMMPFWPNVN